MKILFLLSQDLESPYGLGRFLPLAKKLTSLGNTIEVVALHPNIKRLKDRKFTINGIKVHYVGRMHVLKTGDIKSYYPIITLLLIVSWATLRLSWAAIRTKADIIHIGKPHPMNSIAGLAAKYIKNKIVFLDCDDLEVSSNKFQRKWQKKVIGFFEEWTIKHVNHITTNTSYLFLKMVSLGIDENKITLISNGVDQDRFCPPDKTKIFELKKIHGINSKKVISYIGSLSLVNHPVDLLLKAFVYVKKKYSNTVLLIVGGGDSFDELNTLAVNLGISANTIFVGRIPPKEVVIYYHISDMIIDPTYDNETAKARSPLKMFESWYCGKLFITGDVGDRKILLGTPPAGIIVNPGDPESIATAIIHIFEHPELSKEISSRGLIRVANFSWEKQALVLTQVYNRSLN